MKGAGRDGAWITNPHEATVTMENGECADLTGDCHGWKCTTLATPALLKSIRTMCNKRLEKRQDLRQCGASVTESVTDVKFKPLFTDPIKYTRTTSGIRLRPWQREPFPVILDSIHQQRGDTILIVFPRQSGKNEFLIHLKIFLLDLYASLPVGGGAEIWTPQRNGLSSNQRLIYFGGTNPRRPRARGVSLRIPHIITPF